ncbi:MAG TPA: phosphatase PAP2 family protein, partial [Thermoanaerobaculia bacterium]|nr:phosphatase PAP2 family protein [Thermoanaerobaculia bacterium]
AIAMAAGGLGAGVAVQILKLVVSRARPELWYGPFFFTDSTSSSFPSGHTAGAFALAGVLIFASPSIAVRLGAFALAGGVAASRVIVFRHWPSDVVAAALIGLAFSWLFARAIVGRNHRDHQL